MGQFKALNIKNWILAKRAFCGTLLEILIPIFFMIMIVLIRNLAKVDHYDQQSFLGNPLFTYEFYGDPFEANQTLSNVSSFAAPYPSLYIVIAMIVISSHWSRPATQW